MTEKGNTSLYTSKALKNSDNYDYYISKDKVELYTLRQTRFIGQAHPWDVCAIAHSLFELQTMVMGIIKGSILIPDNF